MGKRTGTIELFQKINKDSSIKLFVLKMLKRKSYRFLPMKKRKFLAKGKRGFAP